MNYLYLAAICRVHPVSIESRYFGMDRNDIVTMTDQVIVNLFFVMDRTRNQFSANKDPLSVLFLSLFGAFSVI